MPLLSYDAPLPARPRRILVNGTSGAGKTTIAQRIAEATGLPYTEIDGLYHGPGWTPRSEFAADVAALAAGERWITEWQYSAVRPLVGARCDLIVWVDPPLHRVMRQLIGRTLRRRWRREILWNGNVEPPLHRMLTDRAHVVRWAWSTRHNARLRVERILSERADLPVVQLRSRGEAQDWLAGPLAAYAEG